MKTCIEEAVVESNKKACAAGVYSLLVLRSPRIAAGVKPGQFVHLLVPAAESLMLRRPFSVYKAARGRLSLLYKRVGKGTARMQQLAPGARISLLGPRGNGFPKLPSRTFPVLVAGGYGIAALYLLAERLGRPGLLLVGGATARDVLCTNDFRRLGWKVLVATEDGSKGRRGLVTHVLDRWLAEREGNVTPEFFACGPDGMLREVARRAINGGWKAWLSMDRHMGCGVGACLACVAKIAADEGGWSWTRVCEDGPVFECRRVVWGDDEDKHT